MKTYRFIFILIILLFCSVAYVYADIKTQASTVTLNVPDSARLDIASANATKTINQGADTETAFDNGYVDFAVATPALTISANKKWKLYARSSNFTGPYTKSAADLKLKDACLSHVTSPFNDFSPLSLIDQEIASYTGPVKRESHPIQYRILLDWTKDIAGTYSATVTYTLATQP
ncbi:MAG: hypothetical protein Q8N76_05525 [Candidatus Omnitrophota bacterium]|nr:hypothetical protein [Candidatus Omnitrophota bacterium]